MPYDSPAQIAALVDLSVQRVWLLDMVEFVVLAQQKKSAKGLHLYVYSDSSPKLSRTGKPVHVSLFEKYLLEKRVAEMF